jgi:hypothetical protein
LNPGPCGFLPRSEVLRERSIQLPLARDKK